MGARIIRFCAFLLAAGSFACASTSGGGGGGMDLERLTVEEIQSVDVATLYDVVQRLRPRWMDVRAATSFGGSTDIVVFQDRVLLGGLDELRRLAPDAARWMEYMNAAKATASLPGLGSRRVGGAIIVHTTDERR